MSFLSIAFLTALPLAAAPILLHLFDRRRNVVIEWGAMQFLIEAASRRTNARKLKQWLLLLLRVLAIAMLVLALARPLLSGSWFSTLDRGETILVVDNSMSMSRTTDDATLHEKAIEKSLEQVADVPTGDFVRVLTTSPYPSWVTSGSLRADPSSQTMVEESLRAIRPTQGSSDMLAALFTALQADVQPTQQQRRIVLLTDGQAEDWRLKNESGWQRLREAFADSEIPTTLEIVQLDDVPDRRNVAVNRIWSNRTVVGSDQTFTLAAEIQNYGSMKTDATTAIWTSGDEELYESQVPELEAGATREIVLKHSIAETGVYAISCRVAAHDPLSADDTATTIVEVVDRVPVGLVEGAAEMAELQRDAFFVQTGLGWIDGQPLAQKAVFAPELIASEQLGRTELDDPHAIVIPNLTQLDAEAAARLEDFVFDGGGLWIALGPRTDIDAFNEVLFADGNGLAPLALDRIVSEESDPSDADQRTTSIDPFVDEHPALAGLQNTEQLDVGDVQVSRRFRFVPSPEANEVSVLLRTTSGEPLATEKYFGRGRVIVLAIPLQLEWSDLVRSQSFVVMLQDWLAYLAQPKATRHNLAPGEPIAIRLADTAVDTATLTTPQGDEIELSAGVEGDDIVFRSSRTILPGNYRIDFGVAGDALPFQVHRNASESNLSALTGDNRERLAALTGSALGANRTGSHISNQSEPLWPVLLMILIAVIAAELLLSGVIARERFGSDLATKPDERSMPGIADSPMPAHNRAAGGMTPKQTDAVIPDQKGVLETVRK